MQPPPDPSRRSFLRGLGAAGLAAGFTGGRTVVAETALKTGGGGDGGARDWEISLAQWSNHRALKGGQLDNLDWAQHSHETYGIDALEYVNQFFCEGDRKDPGGVQPRPQDYIAEMKKRTDDLGMTNVLVMCDGVGQLGDPDEGRRTAAVGGHYAWLEVAKFLGCHSIRVNAGSDPKLDADEQARLCADGLARLSAHAAETYGLNVIVENHGGLSSDGAWLSGVMKAVGMDNCGTLPDFGNFYLARKRGDDEAARERFAAEVAVYQGREGLEVDDRGLYYDRYQGIADLMPYAKGVSAKSHDFDAGGNEVHTDFGRALDIVAESGYRGYIGVEYEGSELGEDEGILATKALLQRVMAGA